MTRAIRAHLRSNIVGYVSLFVALTMGSAYALNGSNTVFSDDIVNGEVKSVDLLNEGIRSEDVRNDTLTGGGLTASDLAANAVSTSEVRNDAVGNSELRNDAVGSSEVEDGDLTGNDVASDSLNGIDINESTLARSAARHGGHARRLRALDRRRQLRSRVHHLRGLRHRLLEPPRAREGIAHRPGIGVPGARRGRHVG